MKLSAKGRYAVTAMLDLALHDGDQPVCAADIAARQGISRPYLEQLLAHLRHHHLVISARGPGGGYRLARASDTIMIADIIAAVDNTIGITVCSGIRCEAGRSCLTHGLWEELSQSIGEFLAAVSLADVAVRPRVREVAARQDERRIIRLHIAAIGARAGSSPLRAKNPRN